MIEIIIRYIKNTFPILWHLIEIINGSLNILLYSKKLRNIKYFITKNYSKENFVIKSLNRKNYKELYNILGNIDQEDLKYFRPFEFSERSIKKALTEGNFMIFTIQNNKEKCAVFFLRIIFTRKAFLGFYVNKKYRKIGIGNYIIKILKETCKNFNIKLFSSVSQYNIPSIRAHLNNDFKKIKNFGDKYIILKSE